MKPIIFMVLSIIFSCQVNKKNAIKQIVYARNFDLFKMKPLDIIKATDTLKNTQWIECQSFKDSIILNVVSQYKHPNWLKSIKKVKLSQV